MTYSYLPADYFLHIKRTDILHHKTIIPHKKICLPLPL